MANPMFNRLVRFKTSTGQVCFGEASETASLKETFTRETLVGKSVRVFSGCSPWDKDFCLSEQREVIHEVSRNAESALSSRQMSRCSKIHAAQ